MKNVMDILKNYYKPVDEAKRSRAFFFSLADYVNHIETTPELKKIIQDTIKEKEEILREKDKYEAKVQQELQESKRIILKIVNKIKKPIPQLNEALKELEEFEKNAVDEYGKADHLEMRLWDVGMVLYQNGYKKELKSLIDDKTDNPNVYLDYKRFRFSPSLIEKRRLNKKIKELRETKLWGCWDYLRLVPVILLERKEFGEVVSTRDIGMAVIYIELQEIIKIRSAIWNEIISLPPQIPPEEAREMLKYKLHASRIHNYLLEELDLQMAKDEDNQPLIAPQKVEAKKSKQKSEIEKITIIKMDNGRYLLAVNDVYDEKYVKKIRDKSIRWEIFIREADQRNIRPETRTNVREIPQDIAGYFNYNTQKCPIYMSGKYKPTEIFTGRNSYIEFNPDIKTEIITEKQYLNRKNRKNKK